MDTATRARFWVRLSQGRSFSSLSRLVRSGCLGAVAPLWLKRQCPALRCTARFSIAVAELEATVAGDCAIQHAPPHPEAPAHLPVGSSCAARRVLGDRTRPPTLR